MIALVLAGCTAPVTCGEPLDPDDPDFPYTGAIPQFELSLSDDARAALPTSPRETGEDVSAVFGWEGEEWTVGLDLKGHTSFRTIDEKPGFKIDFGEYTLDQTFHGVRRLTLNNLVGDRTGLVEGLVYGAYAAAGLPAPRHTYACVTVDGADYGVYSLVETMDEAFLARAFEDPTGWLYDRGGEADLTAEGLFSFEVEEEGEGEAHADLATLVDELVASEEVLPVLEARFDADALIRELALEIAVASVDGYALNANNFLLYHEPAPDRWWLLPWGIDRAFQPPGDTVVTVGGRPGVLAERCFAEADCAARLEEELVGMADVIAPLAAEARDRADTIGPLLQADPKAEAEDLDRWSAWQDLFGFLDVRPGVLASR